MSLQCVQVRKAHPSNGGVETSEEHNPVNSSSGAVSAEATTTMVLQGEGDTNPVSISAAQANFMTQNVGTIYYMSPEVTAKRKTRLVYDEVSGSNHGHQFNVHFSDLFDGRFCRLHWRSVAGGGQEDNRGNEVL